GKVCLNGFAFLSRSVWNVSFSANQGRGEVRWIILSLTMRGGRHGTPGGGRRQASAHPEAGLGCSLFPRSRETHSGPCSVRSCDRQQASRLRPGHDQNSRGGEWTGHTDPRDYRSAKDGEARSVRDHQTSGPVYSHGWNGAEDRSRTMSSPAG